MSKSTGCRNEPSTSENDTMTMRMRFLFAALTLALAAGSCSREPRTELFNGRDLTGWVCVTDPEGVGDARDAFSATNSKRADKFTIAIYFIFSIPWKNQIGNKSSLNVNKKVRA